MCGIPTIDPVAAAGLAMETASGVIRGVQGKKYDEDTRAAELDAYKVSSKARTDEIGRQAKFDTEGQGFFQDTANKLSRANYDANSTSAANGFMQVFDEQPGAVSLGPNDMVASGRVAQEMAARTSAASADARKRVQALAKLTSFDNANQGRAAAIQNSGDKLSTLSGIRAGSLGVSDLEQSLPPRYVPKPDSLVADLLSGTGAILSRPIFGKRTG